MQGSNNSKEKHLSYTDAMYDEAAIEMPQENRGSRTEEPSIHVKREATDLRQSSRSEMRRTFQEGADGNGPTAKQRRTTANPLNTDAENRMEGGMQWQLQQPPVSTEEGKRRLLVLQRVGAVAGVMVVGASPLTQAVAACANVAQGFTAYYWIDRAFVTAPNVTLSAASAAFNAMFLFQFFAPLIFLQWYNRKHLRANNTPCWGCSGKIPDELFSWFSRGTPGWRGWFIPLSLIPPTLFLAMWLGNDCGLQAAYGIHNCRGDYEAVVVLAVITTYVPLSTSLLLCCMEMAPHVDRLAKLVESTTTTSADAATRYAADLPPDALGRFKTAVEEASDALNATIAKMNAAFLYPNISLWLLTVMVDFWDTLDATKGNFDDYRNTESGAVILNMAFVFSASLCLITLFVPVVFVNTTSSTIPQALLTSMYHSKDGGGVLVAEKWFRGLVVGWKIVGFKPNFRLAKVVAMVVATVLFTVFSGYVLER